MPKSRGIFAVKIPIVDQAETESGVPAGHSKPAFANRRPESSAINRAYYEGLYAVCYQRLTGPKRSERARRIRL